MGGISRDGIERCHQTNCRAWAHYEVTIGGKTTLYCLEHGKHVSNEHRSLYIEGDA